MNDDASICYAIFLYMWNDDMNQDGLINLLFYHVSDQRSVVKLTLTWNIDNTNDQSHIHEVSFDFNLIHVIPLPLLNYFENVRELLKCTFSPDGEKLLSWALACYTYLWFEGVKCFVADVPDLA